MTDKDNTAPKDAYTEHAQTILRLRRLADIKAAGDIPAPQGVTKMFAAFARSEDGRRAVLHSWTECAEDGRVYDAKHAAQTLDLFAGLDKGIVKGKPTTPLLFSVWLTIERTHRNSSLYSCDFHKHDGCPLCVIKDGMDLYREFKRVTRNARETKREAKAKLKAAREAAQKEKVA
jgi:hypothetical protein